MNVEARFSRGLLTRAAVGFTLFFGLKGRSLLWGRRGGCLSRWDHARFALELGGEAFRLVGITSIAIIMAGFLAELPLHLLELAVELARYMRGEGAMAARGISVRPSSAHAILQ